MMACTHRATTMTRRLLFTVLLLSLASFSVYASSSAEHHPNLETDYPYLEVQRDLQQRIFDIFDDEVDVCKHGEGDYRPCDKSLFPVCTSDELICYNRRPRRDKFYASDRQPYFYIDYRSVLCYPTSWEGCSSCTPGRYCMSERRCVLDEIDYPCSKWI